jgi:hypothetical protein
MLFIYYYGSGRRVRRAKTDESARRAKWDYREFGESADFGGKATMGLMDVTANVISKRARGIEFRLSLRGWVWRSKFKTQAAAGLTTRRAAL